ncbi:hypothetical protein HPB50_019625 [Hyalomma asiaticum]|uniref:Uncharacterized protein n=1 Tax=Hyalomma asiaticum TaxID=266040 RepID=A0ACB7RNQ2_HYAAI|nr:hypothetical protein HPB50_019625 [Hyalomma asiaticum]
MQRTHVDSGELLGMPVILGVVYLSVARVEDVGNCQIVECIKKDVIRWAEGKQVLLMGDFNGHIQPLDGHQDVNGSLLVQLAEDLSLEVTNLRSDCEGMVTWCARNSQSCIDYAIVSRKLAMHIARVHVDGSGQYRVGSDQ